MLPHHLVPAAPPGWGHQFLRTGCSGMWSTFLSLPQVLDPVFLPGGEPRPGDKVGGPGRRLICFWECLGVSVFVFSLLSLALCAISGSPCSVSVLSSSSSSPSPSISSPLCISPGLQFYFLIFVLFLCECFACMYPCEPWVCLVPAEVGEERARIPWELVWELNLSPL